MCVVLDEAEATGRLVEAIEAHDEALDLAALGEELVDLLFCCVEGAVEDLVRIDNGAWAWKGEQTGCRRIELPRSPGDRLAPWPQLHPHLRHRRGFRSFFSCSCSGSMRLAGPGVRRC